MWRKRASADMPVMTRNGVTASTTHKKRSVQSPVARDKASAGLAPNWLAIAAYSSQQNGIRDKPNTSGLAKRLSATDFTRTSVVTRGCAVANAMNKFRRPKGRCIGVRGSEKGTPQ